MGLVLIFLAFMFLVFAYHQFLMPAVKLLRGARVDLTTQMAVIIFAGGFVALLAGAGLLIAGVIVSPEFGILVLIAWLIVSFVPVIQRHWSQRKTAPKAPVGQSPSMPPRTAPID